MWLMSCCPLASADACTSLMAALQVLMFNSAQDEDYSSRRRHAIATTCSSSLMRRSMVDKVALRAFRRPR